MSEYGDALERQAAKWRVLAAECDMAEKAYHKARLAKEDATKRAGEAWAYLHELFLKEPG